MCGAGCRGTIGMVEEPNLGSMGVITTPTPDDREKGVRRRKLHRVSHLERGSDSG